MDIEIEVRKRFETPAPPAEVFSVLADVPRSVSHYPDVVGLDDMGEGTFKWTLAKMGAAGISHQVCYACTYESDPRALTVVWSPVEGVGNGVIQGRWELSAAGSGTLINFENTGLLKIPIPRLLKSAGVPFVKAAFARQIETYIENLCRTFSDGVS